MGGKGNGESHQPNRLLMGQDMEVKILRYFRTARPTNSTNRSMSQKYTRKTSEILAQKM